MPAKYDLTKVEADFDHGTLNLRVPRSEAAQKRSISVRSGGQLAQPKTVEAEQPQPTVQPSAESAATE